MKRVTALGQAVTRVLSTAGLAAATASVTVLVLRAGPPGGSQRWTRTNHRGEPISLTEGPAYVVGAVAGAAFGAGKGRVRAATVLIGTAAGVLGAYDDFAEGTVRKGLAGHFSALARGEVTTGAVKVLGLSVAGLAAAALAGPSGLDGPPPKRSSPIWAGEVARTCITDALISGAIIAGSANLLNLFDVRPGRALKVVLTLAPTAFGAGPAAVPIAAAAGAAAALLPDDLAERTMLGDTGANAAGGILGLAAASAMGRRAKLVSLAVLIGLTAASERFSFSAVIDRTPLLREWDRWGRRIR